MSTLKYGVNPWGGGALQNKIDASVRLQFSMYGVFSETKITKKGSLGEKWAEKGGSYKVYNMWVPFPCVNQPYTNLPVLSKQRHSALKRILFTTYKFYSAEKIQRVRWFYYAVWDQGSVFHIAAGSYPVQEVWVLQDSLYMCQIQIQKLLQCCQRPYQQISLVIMIQKKYSLTSLQCTVL